MKRISLHILFLAALLAPACKKDEGKPADPSASPAPAPEAKAPEATPPEATPSAPNEKDCVDEKNFKDLATCEALCAAGNANGCYVAGQEYLMNDDEAKAGELFTRACDGGSAYGCKWLAPMHRNGLGGIAKDEAKAKALEDKAVTLYPALCEGGKVQACWDLAGLIEGSDPARAKTLYKLACDAGKTAACDKAK